MDEAAKIAIRTRYLRLKYGAGTDTPDTAGLNAYITQLGDNAGAESVVITSQSFEGTQSSGQLVLEPLIELAAAMAVLAEIDPDNSPAERPDYSYIRFGRGCAPVAPPIS